MTALWIGLSPTMASYLRIADSVFLICGLCYLGYLVGNQLYYTAHWAAKSYTDAVAARGGKATSNDMQPWHFKSPRRVKNVTPATTVLTISCKDCGHTWHARQRRACPNCESRLTIARI